MNFDEISAQIWNEMRYGGAPGNDSEFTADFITSGINYNALVKGLSGIGSESLGLFDCSAYISGIDWNVALQKFVPSYDTLTNLDVDFPFEYTTEKGVKIEARSVQAALNKKVDRIYGLEAGFSIDPAAQSISTIVVFRYTGTDGYRKFELSTPQHAFHIDDKYVAVKLTADNLTDYCYLLKALKGDYLFVETKAEITEAFARLILSASTWEELNFLYSNLPDFVIERLSTSNRIKREELILHLQVLAPIFKRVSDLYLNLFIGTNAIINIFRILVSNGSTANLYNALKEHPELVRMMYDSMSGVSTADGWTEKNQVIFANLMYVLCVNNAFSGLLKDQGERYHKYRIGGEFHVDSNLDASNDPPGKIFLRQWRTVTTTRTYLPMAKEASYQTEEQSEDHPYDGGHYYHPFELVQFVDMRVPEKDRISMLVPAIYVKALADQKEWEEIGDAIRIGADVLAIILGVVTLGGATPLLLIASIIDVSLITTDIILTVYNDEIRETEWGLQFLEGWEKILLIGGIALATPGLVRATFMGGAKILVSQAARETKDFVKASLIKIIDAHLVGTNKTILNILDKESIVAQELRGLIQPKYIRKLQERGVVFISYMEKVDNLVHKGVGVYYDGELVAFGNYKQLTRKLQPIYKLAGDALEEALVDLWEQIPRLSEDGKSWTVKNSSGSYLIWQNQKAQGMSLATRKSLVNTIENLKVHPDPEKKWVGTAADELNKSHEVISINNKIDNVTNNKPGGDIDLETPVYFIECKTTLTKNSMTTDFMNQFRKYYDPSHPGFINPLEKKVILAIGKIDNIRTLRHPKLEYLRKNGVIISVGTNDLKKLR